ncbi:hypothetical protein [Salininema proteolyticum]|uniref:Uncharacterized protein n=1 Tax=Salininema proteolyticum TaxID=1607685 RepID=A0ABV8U4N8_9ACTN
MTGLLFTALAVITLLLSVILFTPGPDRPNRHAHPTAITFPDHFNEPLYRGDWEQLDANDNRDFQSGMEPD